MLIWRNNFLIMRWLSLDGFQRTRNVKEKVVNLRKYFEVVELSLLESEQITRIACRTSGYYRKKAIWR